MALAGTNMVCSVGRFRKYVEIINDREYCDVKELAGKSGRSLKAVVKDLKKMIRKGWFCQGHLDEKDTCLMVSDSAYSQYTGLMERMRGEKEEREAAAAKHQQEFARLSPEVQKIVQAGMIMSGRYARQTMRFRARNLGKNLTYGDAGRQDF